VSAAPRLSAEAVRVEVPGPQGRAGPAARLLDGVSLELWAGECVGLVGPNGAGKTTLLRVLGGALQPSSGLARLDGVPVGALAPRSRARRLGQVAEAAGGGIDFACLDVVLMGRYPHLAPLQPEGAADFALARAALREVELDGVERRLTSTLSAGERQRLAFARTRCQQATVLLCDEPTANLDLRHRALLFEILRGCAAAGGAVLAALHDLDLAARYCGRLVLLVAGRVLADGPPAAVLTRALLEEAYGVRVEVHTDPATGAPRVTVLGPL